MEKTKKIRDIFKQYWYYNGAWHKAMCNFIRFDEGVCNCKTGKNQERITEKIEKILSLPTKVKFYTKKNDKIIWRNSE